jgi:hypothetical protein
MNYCLQPDPEIAQIIREPARAAGLRFEEDADQGQLEDVLQERLPPTPIATASRIRSRRTYEAGPRPVDCSPSRRIVRWAALKEQLRAVPTKWSTPCAHEFRMLCRRCCGL